MGSLHWDICELVGAVLREEWDVHAGVVKGVVQEPAVLEWGSVVDTAGHRGRLEVSRLRSAEGVKQLLGRNSCGVVDGRAGIDSGEVDAGEVVDASHTIPMPGEHVTPSEVEVIESHDVTFVRYQSLLLRIWNVAGITW